VLCLVGLVAGPFRTAGFAVFGPAVWSSAEQEPTLACASADRDGDGDLDLAAGNDERPNRIYESEDGSLTLAWFAPPPIRAAGAGAPTGSRAR
jgi:hypothetical protein